MTGYMPIGSNSLATAPSGNETTSLFIMPVFTFPQQSTEEDSMTTLIGLYVTPGFGLLDTGAQHGVIGSSDYDHLCQRLASQGLKPRPLLTLKANAIGVGGITTFITSAEKPIGIQRCS